MKKVAMWVGAIILSPFLLFIILTILLYLPPVQNWAVHKVADIASEKTGMSVSVEKVRLAFPLDLSVSGFRAIQRNEKLPQVRDTIADVGNLVVNVQLRPLLSKQVVINTLDLRQTKLNTANFVASARVKGSLDRLFLTSRGIDLDRSTVDVTNALLDGAKLDVQLSDTVPPDTTETQNLWKIYISKVDVANTDATIHMPGDTLQVAAHIGKASVERGLVDLENEEYTVGNFTLSDGVINYDNRFEPRLKGLDVNHIALTDIACSIDSIRYKAPETQLAIRYFRLKEKSGIELSDLQGRFAMDSLKVELPTLTASTPDSHIEAQLTMDLNTFDDKNPGKMYLRLIASIGKQDIMRFCGDMPQQFVRRYPNQPLSIRGAVNGNLKNIDITGLEVKLPTAFKLNANGNVKNALDINRLSADVKLNGRTENLGFVTCMLDPSVMRNYRVPSGIGVKGNVKARGRKYATKLTLTESTGRVDMDGAIDLQRNAYNADLKIKNLNVRHFMPKDSIGTVTANATVKGRGFDFLSKSCTMDANAAVTSLHYGKTNISDVTLNANLANGIAHALLDSHNDLLEGTVNLDALVSTTRIDATLGTDLRKADLNALRLTSVPMTVGACAHIDVTSDLKQSHSLKGRVDDMAVITAKKTFRPADLSVDLLTNPDTTWANVSSGNLELKMHAQGGYEHLMQVAQNLQNELQSHLKNRIIDQAKIRSLLPQMDVHFMSGSENPFANFLRMKGMTFNEINLNLNTSPHKGLNGNGHIYSLVVDSTRIDTVAFRIVQSDTTQVHFYGRVENNKRNPQFVFRALFDGDIQERGAALNLNYYDAHDSLGLSLGAQAEMLDSGINVHFAPYRPVLGYKEFNLNKDNYIFLGRNQRISTKLDIVADDGTGIKAFSNDDDKDVLQDLTLSLNKFDLAKITSVMPYAPRIDGLLNGDFRLIMNKDEKISVLSDLAVSDMAYEHYPMGDISTEFVYLQNDSVSHFVDGRLSRNDVEVGTLKGTYTTKNGGEIDAKLNLARTPMEIVNGFIPDQIFGINGYADGELAVKGAVSSPQVDGEVYLDSAYIVSVPYGMNLRLDNDPVRIVGSNLLLENFSLYAHNDNPLVVSGNVDFSNLEKIMLSMRMRAQDYMLINSKKTSKSVAYGKAYVNFFGALNGDLDNLSMKGTLDVLGKTDVTYILTSSPLSTDDQLSGLVTFTDFRDTTTQVAVAKPQLSGLDVQMMVNIESGARVFCALNADQSNYVDVEGGGELRMVYNATDDLQLYGRYTMTDGEMKYSLPVIPLKTFTIANGSYVEFSGDVMNPRLNIEATEETKASVSSDDGSNRTVLFNCGVKVTQTLNNMGLEFTLDAPEDMTIKNELAAMSTEKRGRLAVTMLTTGMYLADGNTGSFSMNSALNSFLQNEINNITNSASRTTDISLGMDQNSDAAGNTYTDYSFKFAKRFWNNRFNFVIGGKFSDGNSTTASNDDENMFIDNVSLEYRLDQSAERYVRVFYNKEAQDLLEDRISEYGAGFVWRKKLERLSDLFRLKNKKAALPQPAKRDSTVNSNEKK